MVIGLNIPSSFVCSLCHKAGPRLFQSPVQVPGVIRHLGAFRSYSKDITTECDEVSRRQFIDDIQDLRIRPCKPTYVLWMEVAGRLQQCLGEVFR